MQFLDSLGWPVERIKDRPITNIIRLLIHTRKIKRGTFHLVDSPSETFCFRGPTEAETMHQEVQIESDRIKAKLAEDQKFWDDEEALYDARIEQQTEREERGE